MSLCSFDKFSMRHERITTLYFPTECLLTVTYVLLANNAYIAKAFTKLSLAFQMLLGKSHPFNALLLIEYEHMLSKAVDL